ncbi:hypothetical protein HpHA244_14580 [Helicobacter pylori]
MISQIIIVYQNILGVSVENDVKEDLEQARPKQELEKLTQEKEQEIKKKGKKNNILTFF